MKNHHIEKFRFIFQTEKDPRPSAATAGGVINKGVQKDSGIKSEHQWSNDQLEQKYQLDFDMMHQDCQSERAGPRNILLEANDGGVVHPSLLLTQVKAQSDKSQSCNVSRQL